MRSIRSDIRAAAFAALILSACHGAMWIVGPLLANNTTTPSKPHTFTAGQTILSSQVNADFDTLYSELQGNVGTANLLDSSITSAKVVDATIVEGDLASAVTLKLEQTGVVKDYIGTTAPSGYVLASGRTIGDASSAATERANADTESLFTLIYNNMSNTEAAVSGGRGASAAADYAAHKTIALPDLRGRVVAGDDNMGGSTASRLTNAGSSIVGTTNGTSGGGETHTLTSAQIPAHSHTITDPGHFHTNTIGGGGNVASGGFGAVPGGTANTDTKTTGITATNNSTGGGGAHPIVQPTYILNKIIKLAAPMEVY